MRRKQLLLVYLLSNALLLFSGEIKLENLTIPENGKWFEKENVSLLVSDMPWKKGILLRCADEEKRILWRTEKPFVAKQIAFVHTMEVGEQIRYWQAETALALRKLALPPKLPTVLKYEITYADGCTLPIAVRYGEGIEEWYRLHSVAPMLWSESVWDKTVNKRTGEHVVLYRMTWPNPRPGIPITEISAKGNGDYGKVLLVDIQANNTPHEGNILYVAPSPIGKDENDGTFDAPLRTLNEALRKALPGDCVYMRGGYYALDEPIEYFYTGENEKWLTISAYPGEDPLLDARGIALARYETITDWKRGPFFWDMGVVSILGDPSYVRIQGLHIHNARRAGISIYGKIGTDENGDRIWGPAQCAEANFNTTYRCYAMGIIIHGIDSVRVIGNQIIRPHSQTMTNTDETAPKTARTELAQEAIDLTENKNFEIAYNTVAGGGKEAIDCINIENGNIHHNYIQSCLNGIYIDSWSKPIRNIDIHHNYIVNAYNGIPLSTEGSGNLFDITIHHNIVIDSKSTGISISEATYKSKPAEVMHHKIYNNTIHNTGCHAQAIGWSMYGIEINGFHSNTQFRDIDIFENIVSGSLSNAIYTEYPGEDWRKIKIERNLLDSISNEPFAEDIIASDPQYANPVYGDFTLLENSPAIRKGKKNADLGALPYGSKWNAGHDWSGKITALYYGDIRWEPLDIPRSTYNLYRNHLQRPSWFQKARYGVDLQNLPSGMQSIAGVTYYIEDEERTGMPSIITLAAWGNEVKQKEIRDIPVNRKAEKLSFLHTYYPATDVITGKTWEPDSLQEGTLLFAYEIIYEDGTRTEIPIHWKKEIDHWYIPYGQKTTLPPVWKIEIPRRKEKNDKICLYATEWKNPFPERKISTFGIINKRTSKVGTPALISVSAGTSIIH